MSDIATPILQWLNTHPELAGLATFLISAAESVAIIGTIVPGSVMMTAIGALVGAGIIPFWSTLFWAILGAIVGDGISYWLGYYFKNSLHDTWPFRQHPNLLARGETFFHTYGSMSVFIGRFVGPVRALVPMVAGMLGLKPLRFTIANVTSAILWAPVYMLPGFILGAASTELPPELAARIILMLLLIALFIGLFFWMVKKIFDLISNKVNEFLTWTWSSLKSSRYFYLITTVLKHHDPKKTHGQLKLTFYFVLISIFFLYLTYFIQRNGSHAVPLNNFVFHLFRSLRTPTADNVMLYITFLGDKYVIVPLFAILFCWFAWFKRWYTAWHILALGILTAGSVKFLEYFVCSPRPWGVLGNDSTILGYSYPSGHTALAFTATLGITLLLIKLLKIKRRTFLYYMASIIIGAVAISRLYFGVHWLSDIIGASLLSAVLLILITISYNRSRDKNIEPAGLILTLIGTLFICYSMTAYFIYNSQKNKYSMLNWPTDTVNVDLWWQQKGIYFPLHRINRFGFSVDVFNVQWIGDLDQIKKILLDNHWQTPPERDWLNALYRVSSVESAEHIPIVSPVYLDKPPVLTFIKYIGPDERLIILRFWHSPFLIKNIKEPLWLGSMELAPSTYSWLFKRKPINRITSASSYLFTEEPKEWDIKEITFKLSEPLLPQKIMLIKPKNLILENKRS